jgi:hypothetical protein
VDLIYSFKPFSNRARLECDLTNSVMKLRDQLQVKISSFCLSDELFYNLTDSFADENRLSAGCTFKAFEQAEINIGYLVRSQRKAVNNDWANTGAILFNTGLKI